MEPPELLLRAFREIAGKDPTHLFLDEIHALPLWSRVLRTLCNRRKYSIVVSGSNAALLEREISTELRGRYAARQLAVYDLSGRIVRTLFRGADDAFLWDGCDSEGNELPPGNYIIQGASAGRPGSVSVVKL